jgi:hypothetical protein
LYQQHYRNTIYHRSFWSDNEIHCVICRGGIEVTMNATLETLKSTISGLPVLERAELVHYLLRTLETEDEGGVGEWLSLAEQRMDDIHSGRVVGIPADEVMKSLQRPKA